MFYKCIDAFCLGRRSEGSSRFHYWTILSSRNYVLLLGNIEADVQVKDKSAFHLITVD